MWYLGFFKKSSSAIVAIGIALFFDWFNYFDIVLWHLPDEEMLILATGFPLPYSVDALYTSLARDVFPVVFVLDLLMMGLLFWKIVQWLLSRMPKIQKWFEVLVLPSFVLIVLYLYGFGLALKHDHSIWDINFYQASHYFEKYHPQIHYWDMRPMLGCERVVNTCCY